MNKYLTIFLLLLSFLLFSCKKEVDYGIGEYRVDWVKVISPNSFSLLNLNETLLTSETTLSNIKEGSRLLLNYSYLSENQNSYSIRINGGSAVFCDTLMQQSPLTDKLSSEPIILESAWIGLHYLNISCYVDLYQKGPVIALVLDREEGDTYFVSFIYDKKKDPAGSRAKVNCSFDLSSLLNSPDKTKRVIVSFNDSTHKTLEFDY